jgi:hypothetical protein
MRYVLVVLASYARTQWSEKLPRLRSQGIVKNSSTHPLQNASTSLKLIAKCHWSFQLDRESEEPQGRFYRQIRLVPVPAGAGTCTADWIYGSRVQIWSAGETNGATWE